VTAGALTGVFSIPAGARFLDDLAAGLAAAYPPETLATARVYLPTRRACRDLVEAFLRLPGTGGLLPAAYPLGDVDTDELAFAAVEPALGLAEQALDLKPAVSTLERAFLLARLAQAKHKAEHGADLPLAASLRLADALGRFLDELAVERVDPKRIYEIDAGAYAEHWQSVLTFLEIVLEHWPAQLEADGRMDPAARREALLQAQADIWTATPPAVPIVIAGSTGALPSTRALMQAVLAAPAGAVVLPGFDLATPPDELERIRSAPSHPQHAMATALAEMEIPQDAVGAWPTSDPGRGESRRRFVGEALRPAGSIAAWARLPPGAFGDGVDGVLRVDAPNEDMEARAIALFLREKVEGAGPDARAALVTPDRALARRTQAELRRWEVEADDSAGRPLGETAVGAYLRLVARACRPGAGAIDWLALLKHPLAAGGMGRARFRRRARALELRVWRNEAAQRKAATLADAAGILTAADRPVLAAFAAAAANIAAPLAGRDAEGAHALADLLEAHIRVAEALAATATTEGAARLWRGADGEAAAARLADALDAAGRSPPVRLADYADAFDALAEGTAVRPAGQGDPRVAILGVLEARLGRFDAVALGGLDEGVWPRPTAADPWFSRAMRREVGLSDAERRVGLSAHDFAQHLAGGDVLLTRSRRRDGAPTKPSRWLERLDACLKAAGMEPLAGTGDAYLDWARRLDAKLQLAPAPPPAPKPPLAARPRRLSVTRVKTLMTDPYAIYARYVLGLKALSPLDPPPSPADRGRIVHDAFERFLKAWPDRLPADVEAAIREAGAAAFRDYADDPAIAAFWRPAFDRAARWTAAAERMRRPALGVARVLAEAEGVANFAAPGGLFRLDARADRIDLLEDGRVAIVDVKTGAPPTKRAIETGAEPQMALEAAIALHGEFGAVSGRETAELAIWQVGGQSAAKAVALDAAKVAAALQTAWTGVQTLVAGFDDPDTPYLSEPGGPSGYSDYRALARLSDEVEDRA